MDAPITDGVSSNSSSSGPTAADDGVGSSPPTPDVPCTQALKNWPTEPEELGTVKLTQRLSQVGHFLLVLMSTTFIGAFILLHHE